MLVCNVQQHVCSLVRDGLYAQLCCDAPGKTWAHTLQLREEAVFLKSRCFAGRRAAARKLLHSQPVFAVLSANVPEPRVLARRGAYVTCRRCVQLHSCPAQALGSAMVPRVGTDPTTCG